MRKEMYASIHNALSSGLDVPTSLNEEESIGRPDRGVLIKVEQMAEIVHLLFFLTERVGDLCDSMSHATLTDSTHAPVHNRLRRADKHVLDDISSQMAKARDLLFDCKSTLNGARTGLEVLVDQGKKRWRLPDALYELPSASSEVEEGGGQVVELSAGAEPRPQVG
ncbi:hypothetical protein [Streptomyces sp. CS014]|uniref:hypothetical protein n=1 Tax=Streptomyces sp. CS014 TaxID=2162707 RepID=UPI000D5215EC|nr:hypothetical protein [Streptomyces sp. CS014]PVD04474.1 hypothetical protein DBP12_03345 [Streptomyces sp. CS014]